MDCKYQPKMDEWFCPKCGSNNEFFYISDPVNFDSDNLDDDDLIECMKCGYETTGENFSQFVLKRRTW